MSSDLQATLELLQMNDYVSVVIVTAVIYDYVLVFSREIDYVWHRPWTWVSTIFVLVRYLGLSFAIIGALGGSTFVPGPVNMCTAIYLVSSWEFIIFLAAADLVMILRVYAMWNQSKRILYILLFIYVSQVIVSFVRKGIYDNPNTYLSVTVVQITIDVAFCNVSTVSNNATLQLLWVITALRMVLGVMFLILAVISTLRESVAMYKATKQWQPNCYMQLFVQDGILYFLLNLIYNISTTLLQNTITPNSTLQLVLVMLYYTTLYPMMPRFIISVRELYDRDLRGRWQGIDTGFGSSSQPVVSGSAIEFAGVAPGQEQGEVAEGGVDDSEAIRLDILGDGTRQV